MGLTELLLIGAVILFVVFISKGQKSEKLKKQQEAERAEAARIAAVAKGTIRYPELQLLGIVITLAGVAMAVAGYLMTKGILDTFSIAGIFVVVLGLAFVVLARQRAPAVVDDVKNSKTQVNGKGNTLKPAQSTTNPGVSSIDPRIAPKDVSDFKKYMALKAKSAEKPIKPEDAADFKKYMALKTKAAEKP
jgi:hypothetical protein